MRVNRIQFDAIKLTWETVKISTAMLFSDRQLDEVEISQDIETGEIVFEPVIKLTPKDKLKIKLDKLEDQGRDFLEREEYILFQEVKELYEIFKNEYDRLK